MKLLLVESPAKAETIAGFLGDGYRVRATQGHVWDLPEGELGVELEGFQPRWKPARGQRNLLAALRRDAEGCDAVLLGTDPDREGEALAHHLATALERTGAPTSRVSFAEVTPGAVRAAVRAPRPIDAGLVAAQQARRVMDRLVGYGVSPLLQRALGAERPLSAGRVQTAALRLLCDRERAIADFAPHAAWTVEATFETGRGAFAATLHRAFGQDVGGLDESAAWHLAEQARLEPFAVRAVHTKAEALRPPPPFTTAALIQAAAGALGLSPARTMRVAQQLYEGVELEDDARVGLLTYPRTDGVRMAAAAVAAARDVLARDFGTEALPPRPHRHAPASSAHEAIRPTDFARSPRAVRKYLTPEQYRLYRLVYERALASQMAAAEVERTTLEAADPAVRFVFRAEGARVRRRGFLQLAPDAAPVPVALPAVAEGARLILRGLVHRPAQAEPPAPLTEADLVGAMERAGIGRPSTYAATVEALRERGYAALRDGALRPTDLGLRACAFLTTRFPDLFDLGFTARMEASLDALAAGQAAYEAVLRPFYHDRLLPALREPALREPALREPALAPDTPSEGAAPPPCERCGRPMARRDGPHGPFFGCTGYPACRHTRPFVDAAAAPCPRCGTGRLVPRTSRREGRPFYGCSAYPACRHTQSEPPGG